MYLPIAHAEGKFVPRNEQVLDQLKNDSQLALTYCLADGSDHEVPYPQNPNGSTANIAGVCDTTGRIFGLMPHPERFIDPTHHPRWTREGNSKAGDGLALFQNAINFFHD